MLVRDPVVDGVLQGHAQDLSPRTVRHHFLRTTGLTQGQIRQIERAQRAAALLEQGQSILDTVDELGYFDQPHLTRSVKQWVGHTPAQIICNSNPEACRSIQDGVVLSDYHTGVLADFR